MLDYYRLLLILKVNNAILDVGYAVSLDVSLKLK